MRIKKLQKRLGKIDLVLFFSLDETPNTNMRYYANYSGLGVLAITKRNSFIVTPEMEYEKALKTGLKIFHTDKKKKILETLSLVLRRKKIKKIGIEENKITLNVYKKLRKAVKGRYVDISDIASKQRMVKESKELMYIEKACYVTDRVFSRIIKNFNFKTELELRKFILQEIKESNCEIAFPPIVASGKHSSMPHYDSSGRIGKGFLMLDFGAMYNGYCSDMTRMIYLGEASDRELSNYNLVLNAVLHCQNGVMEKRKFSDLYDLALENLGEKAEYFTHALGHGLGLDIHEPPSLYSEDKNKIQDNITFTVEPGIYFSGRYGIRIEDTVVVKNGKLKILTKSPKELTIIR